MCQTTPIAVTAITVTARLLLLMQDPKAAGDVTHVVVGEGGLSALPPQLQPGSSGAPALSGTQTQRPQQSAATPSSNTAAGVPVSSGGVGGTPGGAGSMRSGLESGNAHDGTSSGTPSSSNGSTGRVYVSHLWVERCLAKGRLLPPADFPPPDPAAEVPTPTAGGEQPGATEELLERTRPGWKRRGSSG